MYVAAQQLRASRSGQDTHNDKGNAHQLEQLSALFVVFFGHFDCSSRLSIQIFDGT